MKRPLLVLIAFASIVAFVATSDSAFAQTGAGVVVFENKCASCHQSAQAQKAPDVSVLRKMTPEAVYAALSKAPHTQIQGLSDDDKKTVSAQLGGRKIGITEVADASKMPNRCASNAPMGDIATQPMWNGWGVDPTSNARFQSASAADLTAAQVPSLKLKWAFGFPLADESYSQPTIVGGRVFLGSDAGAVYSLDAATGCVYWSFQTDGAMRVSVSIAPVKGPRTTKYAAISATRRPTCTALMPRAANCCGK